MSPAAICSSENTVNSYRLRNAVVPSPYVVDSYPRPESWSKNDPRVPVPAYGLLNSAAPQLSRAGPAGKLKSRSVPYIAGAPAIAVLHPAFVTDGPSDQSVAPEIGPP